MGYQATSIAKMMRKLNGTHFLPAIQREFVWKPEQIVQVFDSIMRGYPISTFLFWQVQPQNVDKWDFYRFIHDFNPRDSHNQIVSNKSSLPEVVLVLDGQQRLTSLFIGCMGSYDIKKKYAAANKANAWVNNHLCIDLFQDASEQSEAADAVEIEIRYGFAFRPKDEALVTDDGVHYWYKVGSILKFETEKEFQTFYRGEAARLRETVPQEKIYIFEDNIKRLYDTIVQKDDTITYFTEDDQDYDRVLDIFARTNMGGTKLSKSDLLLSMVTAKWEGMNAREAIHEFVDTLNNDLSRRNDFSKDFILKTALALADLPVQYQIENFNNQNLLLIQKAWDQIKKAITDSVELVNSFGIDRENLTSANALIPIIYFAYRHPKLNLRGTTPVEHTNALNIQRWLIMVLFNKVFSGSSDTILAGVRRVLQESADQPQFPMDTLNTEIRRQGRIADFNQAIGEFLGIEYSDSEAFLALSLLYDEKGWGVMQHHKDHIFPKSLFRVDRLQASGLPSDKQKRYAELYNNIGNLQLLMSQENTQKKATPFEKWITTRDVDFKRRHLIPDDSNLLRFECFEEFVAERERLIQERLNTLFSV